MRTTGRGSGTDPRPVVRRTIVGPRAVRSAVVAALLVPALLLASCGGSAQGEQGPVDEVGRQITLLAGDETDGMSQALAEQLRASGLESFASAVEQLSISQVLDGVDYTLLAPNDEAFLELDGDESAELTSDPERLAEIFSDHLVLERLDAAALGRLETVRTASGTILRIEAEPGPMSIGGATVVATDVAAGDGTIHVVDRILTR